MNETIAKGLLILAILLGCAAGGAAAMYVHDQKAYVKLSNEYSGFKASAKQAGEDFKAKVAEVEAKNQSDKEKADEKHKRDLAAARDDTARMRVERDAERGRRFLAEAPAGSKCPDGQVCFDRPLFDAAHGKLVEGLRRSADSCQAVEVALKVGMDWADGN